MISLFCCTFDSFAKAGYEEKDNSLFDLRLKGFIYFFRYSYANIGDSNTPAALSTSVVISISCHQDRQTTPQLFETSPSIYNKTPPPSSHVLSCFVTDFLSQAQQSAMRKKDKVLFDLQLKGFIRFFWQNYRWIHMQVVSAPHRLLNLIMHKGSSGSSNHSPTLRYLPSYLQ